MTIRALKPVQDYAPSTRDHASGGYSLGALEARLSDCQNQPDWRDRSDKAHAYYDMGKQLTLEREHQIKVEMGIEPRQTNLVHGVINGVLGQEAKGRSDVRIAADDDEFVEVSDVLSASLKEAQREANADMAVSNAYAGQVKGGIGWAEVSRASDPLDYPYRVQEVHRREIWWDMRAKNIGLTDATWLIRKRWEDLDESVAQMPQFKDVLTSAVDGWDLISLPEDSGSYLRSSYNRERSTSIHRDEWCDSRRRRIKFYEVWYRVPAEVVVLYLGRGKQVMYDQANPLHVEAVSRGRVRVGKQITRQVRMALFAGPHRLIDVGTTRRSFPYVPFFGFRDDDDGSPYGLIEGMIAPQDGFNERRQMIDWMLKARQVQIDNDALDQDYNTIQDVTRGAARPDFTVILDANRRNAQGFQIKNDLQLQAEQFQMMQADREMVQEVPRIYSSQLGNAPAGVTSGIANSLLIEQGAVAMGELNDNYRFARKLVYEQLLDLIVEDHLDEDLAVTLGSGQTRRTIVLNTWDPQTGAPKNRVKDAPIKVGLSDVPSSPAFRMQEQQQIATMIQALAGNPAALNILAPVYLETSSIANGKALADDLRRATGVPVADDRQAQQAQQAELQQRLAEQKKLEQAKAQSEIAESRTKATLNEASAELNRARAAHLGHQTAMDVHAATQPQQQPADAQDALIDDAMAEARAA